MVNMNSLTTSSSVNDLNSGEYSNTEKKAHDLSVCPEVYVTQSDLPDLEDYIYYLKKIWKSKWLTNDGNFVQLLEKQLKDFFRVKNILLVSNGTLALQIALKVLDISGEVITTPFTFAATTNAILWEGLKPVFADIDPYTFNLNPEDIEKKITPQTSAIMAVHTYGNPCYVEEIQKIAEDNDLFLIYDAAHAFNVEYEHSSVLDYGDISTLSFHATKAFNTIEGGAMAVKNNRINENIRLIRNHGIASEDEVLLPGTNAKMNEFQAAMGLCNLKNVEDNIENRRTIYEFYKDNLQGWEEIRFQKIIASQYNYAYMPVCFNNQEVRDHIYHSLSQEGYYPRKYFYPLTSNYEYLKNKYPNLDQDNDLKVAGEISNSILCLPLYPNLSINDTEKIVKIIQNELNNQFKLKW